MEAFLLDHQQDIFSGVFYGSIILFAIAEFLYPRLKAYYGIGRRWSTNLGLAAVNLPIAAIVIPISSIIMATQAQENGWGLMNIMSVPLWLALPVSVLSLDMFKYWEHRLLHGIPLLWRMHVIHHADLDIDFTTSVRHHPFEATLVAIITPLLVLAAGVPVVAVIVFQILAAISAVYTHANIRYPDWFDNALRLVLVTRYVHLVHHSAKREETDSNFGGVFLFWDRMFGTYKAKPAAGLDEVTVGVEYFRTPRDLVIDRVLMMPFLVPRNSVLPATAGNSADSLTEPPAP